MKCFFDLGYALHPHTTNIRGAMDYLTALADPQKAPQVLAAQVKALKQTGFDSIKILIGLIPGVSLILWANILRWFPLKDIDLDKMRANLLELHAQKHEKLGDK